MDKKLMLLVALASIAVAAAPASASASPELVEGTTTLGTGANVDLTSHNVQITNTALGTVECETWTFTAAVDKNTGSEIEAHGTSGQTANCLADTFTATITKPTLIALFTKGGDEGAVSLTFIVDVGPFECHFAGDAKFNYTTGTDELHFPNVPLEGTEICNAEEGMAVFEGDFTMTTNSGIPVKIE